MPTFTDQPDHSDERSTLQLVRVPEGRGIQGYVTNDRILACPVHWWNGRTTPHEAENCEPCQNNRTYAWKSYFGVWLPSTGSHVLLELTARTSKFFEEYLDKYGSLRGCAFKAQRIGGRITARCTVATKPGDLTSITLPKPPDVQKILLNIWGFRDDGQKTDKRQRDDAKAAINRVAEALKHQEANGNGKTR